MSGESMTSGEKSRKFFEMLREYGDTLRKALSPESGSISGEEKMKLEAKLTDLRDDLQDMYEKAIGV